VLKADKEVRMLYANGNQGRIQATPGTQANCSCCGNELLAKCGEIKQWHWAHQAGDCDPWYEPESEWHLGWKALRADAEQTEVTIKRDGIIHRADIVCADGTVLELQHSSISPEEIRERERFYGKIAWLFDARTWNIQVFKPDSDKPKALKRTDYTLDEFVKYELYYYYSIHVDALMCTFNCKVPHDYVRSRSLYKMFPGVCLFEFHPEYEAKLEQLMGKFIELNRRENENIKSWNKKHIRTRAQNFREFHWKWARQSVGTAKGLLHFDLGNNRILQIDKFDYEDSLKYGDGHLLTYQQFVTMMNDN
jgi:hypothetical protein